MPCHKWRAYGRLTQARHFFLASIHVSYLICSSPNTSLPQIQEEIRSLVNVLGNVSIASSYMDAIIEIERQRKFDGVIFSGHSTDDGFEWGDDIISASEFVSICSLASAKWIFLNSCQSDTFVATINNYLPHCDIVATKADVEDDRALRAMRVFVSSLHSERTVSAAIRKAKIAMPGQEYIYYPRSNGDVEKRSDENENSVEKRLADLELIVFGNDKMRLKGLQDSMANLSKTIEGVRWWQMVNIFMMIVLILVFFLRNG